MAAPTPTELGALLGRPVTTEQADAVLAVVTGHARAYTRGRGFTDGIPNSDIHAVILSAAARLVSHPAQVGTAVVKGPEQASWTAAPFAFSLAERMTLDRYRVNAL
ncbi:Uncharacterised protein [Mycobacteroides abscessus subsp. abscessus]|uniref:hypothetical protein n=1 Tax=Mycobacteroides abscessus TaxID=36809 RepID=UPI000929C9E0|nr:hypothetical protein [Mycobacteroides abscessus]SHX04580.1 Uncharacterised protein [Mycobacteroides abscessus subsp. abscessus]SID11928.1 Uncharacterised protein [Mycobacteroides abscessus subsp. abscessus]SIE18663.1 Uncharacterised protein [Mycobacteroides abscessus subsp. abscessus]SIH46892.1 Uncharacterised protein [Mycobacteroides abscessus subsp. abscessus]SKK58029.1 Uncharacterised protein [Mycobacteroides abscessus subsp. abscessus]